MTYIIDKERVYYTVWSRPVGEIRRQIKPLGMYMVSKKLADVYNSRSTIKRVK